MSKPMAKASSARRSNDDDAGEAPSARRRTRTKSILDMAGMLEAPKGQQVSVEDMNPWR